MIRYIQSGLVLTMFRSAAVAMILSAAPRLCGEEALESGDHAKTAVFQLGEFVVFGEKPTPADLVPAQLDASRIQLLERKDLSQALVTLPGVTLTRFAGRNDASVYIRGFSRNQVPLFIDGVPVYVPYDGTIDMGRFTTYDVAAISVAKGFSSVLYGPNTMGGAINLITRQPTAPIEGELGAGFFSGDGYEASLNVGGRQPKYYFQVGASYVDQDHYDVSDDFVPVAIQGHGKRVNSSHRDWKVSAKAAYTPNSTDEYAFGFIHQEGEKGNPPVTNVTPSYWRWPMWNKETVYLVSNTKMGAASFVKPRVYFDKYDNSLAIYDDIHYSTQNNFNAAKNSGSGTSIYNDYSYGESVELGTDLIAHQSIRINEQYKFDHHRERPDILHRVGTRFTDEDEGYSTAAEDTVHLDPNWDLQAGLDYDHHSTVKAVDSGTGKTYPGAHFDAFNPQAGLFFKPSPVGAARFTFSHKSRFPTMKERYSYRMPDSKGNPQGMPNPGLKPEYANHYEVGYNGAVTEGLSVNTGLFYSRIRDTITSVVVTPAVGSVPAVSQFQNVGISEKYGVDIGADYRWNWLTLGGSYSRLQQKTLSILPSNTTPIQVTAVPGNSSSGHLEIRPWKWLSLVPSVQYSSWFFSTSDGKSHDTKLPGYTLLNFKVAARLSRQVTLSGGVNNLTDKNYQLQDGYPEAGRNWYLDCRYIF